MIDNEKKCPLCHSAVTYYGEGGYGKCTDNNCTFEQKIEDCDTEPCKSIDLEEKKELHSAND
ncbi:MAG: hypothetical protein JEZ08_01620 [Clostridiales bacterium]|nr:hypothetical protein [Clostridiales bacterium]